MMLVQVWTTNWLSYSNSVEIMFWDKIWQNKTNIFCEEWICPLNQYFYTLVFISLFENVLTIYGHLYFHMSFNKAGMQHTQCLFSIKQIVASMVYSLLWFGPQPRPSDWWRFTTGWTGGDTPSVFSTLTQLKFLWFTNFFCLPYRTLASDWRSTGSLAVSQGIILLACSLLIKGNLEESGA